METKHTPWRYAVNIGPTKGRIVDAEGFTILELENHLKSSKFEKIIKQICQEHNAHDDLLAALKMAVEAVDADKSWEDSALAAILKAEGKE